MTISRAVVHLAMRAYETTLDQEKLQVLDLLATMPKWVELRRLDEWENLISATDFWDISQDDNPEDSAPSWALIEEIYEFGRHNMYGAVVEKTTVQEYDQLLEKFNKEGIAIEPRSKFDLSRW